MVLCRRKFIASAASVAGLHMLRAAGVDSAAACVRLGVISDTHVTGPESVARLAAAFRFLRDRGVEAVLHCGDVTDRGTLAFRRVREGRLRDDGPDLARIRVGG